MSRRSRQGRQAPDMSRCGSNRMRGQAMTEYIIILPVLLLLILGIIQFGLIYQAKTTINLATFEAARAGALNNARRSAIQAAFARGMAPLYTGSLGEDDSLARNRAVQRARDRVKAELPETLDDLDESFVCIERINPTEAAFQDYASAATNNMIPADHLLWRVATPGAQSGLSIQDANLLKIRVTYCYPMIVPLVGRTISSLMLNTYTDLRTGEAEDTSGVLDAGGSFRRRCWAEQRIPIVSTATVRMQTPAINDVFSEADDCS